MNLIQQELAYLDEMVASIIEGAGSEAEQWEAFRRTLAEAVKCPAAALIAGQPVELIRFGYDGNPRRGLTATCRAPDAREYVVAAADVVLPLTTQGGRDLAAYRRWLGIDPFPPGSRTMTVLAPPAKVPRFEGPVELIVLSAKLNSARCRIPGTDQTLTLRPAGFLTLVPGEIAVVKPAKQWTYARHPYLSGSIESTRLDVIALGLVPLRLEQQGIWDPAEHYWGEPGDPIGDWAKPIIRRGPRPEYEMEQVLPGADPDNFDSDPIIESNDRKDAGDWLGARKILMDLCLADLRCLDAHAHLGNLEFERCPQDALRHYEAGYRIGSLSLGEGFTGLLPWGWIDNRPFLRCMSGYGLSLWRLKRFKEAAAIFDRMLWLNPSDNQGIRFLIDDVRRRQPWEAGRHD